MLYHSLSVLLSQTFRTHSFTLLQNLAHGKKNLIAALTLPQIFRALINDASRHPDRRQFAALHSGEVVIMTASARLRCSPPKSSAQDFLFCSAITPAEPVSVSVVSSVCIADYNQPTKPSPGQIFQFVLVLASAGCHLSAEKCGYHTEAPFSCDFTPL